MAEESIEFEFGTLEDFLVVKDDLGVTSTISSYGVYSDQRLIGLTSSGSTFIRDSDTGKWYVFDESNEEYVEFPQNPYELPIVYEPLLLTSFIDQTVGLLSSTAIEYGYDSIDNAISYYNSSVTAWAEEAAAFNTWRDNTLSLMYQNIFSFTADGVTLPDLDGFTGQTGYAQLALGEPSRPRLI
jgi:hypothetical protein